MRDGFEEAFREWDEGGAVGYQHVPLARGTQPHALPISARTTTLSDPLTTAVLAHTTRRPAAIGQTLEEVLRALADEEPDLASA
ncbi:MAG TPA: hypothetical protein VNO30_36985 [Kofleriaceae bacterium]|nr:hypothetical protein [Kofleriaceae bacterium]